MAAITTRETAGTGATVNNAPLTNAQLDNNFININTELGQKYDSTTSRTANTFLAAPSGTAGAATFRAIVAADVPTLNQNTTGTASNVTGTVAVANGGTGSTTTSGARTNLGLVIGTDVQAYSSNLAAIAGLTPTLDNFIVGNGTTWILETPAQARTSLGGTTTGQNLFTITNPSAISFLRINADNTVSALDAATFRGAIGAGTSSTTGTVTSVGGTGTVSGLSLSGTVTSSGNLTLSGTLSVVGSNFGSQTANHVFAAPNGSAGNPGFRALVAADIPTLNQNTTGNASTASAWQTARTITIGNTGKSVDGSVNVTWTRTEIVGAIPSSGAWFSSGAPVVGSDGVMEIGRYIDFHTSNTSTADFDGRLDCTGTNTFTFGSGSTVTAGTFSGNLSGNATTATSATDSTKLPLTGGTLTGKLNSSANDSGRLFESNNTSAGGPVQFFIEHSLGNVNIGNARGAVNISSGALQQGGNQVLHAGNYNSYSPTLTGGNASGTWGINITGNSANITAFTINQNLGTANQPTFDSIITSNNGNGTNIRLGDDVWLGDFNLANTFRVRGVQDSTQGYITFGSDAAQLGRSGTGALTWGGNALLHAANYNSYSPTLTGGNASGTWSINVTGSSGSISGFGNPTTASTGSTIVYRDGNGYITNNYFHTSSGGAERNASGMGYFAGFNSSDYYIRSYTPAAARASMGLASSDVVTFNDIYTMRPGSPTTGVIYLGNTGSRYVYFDGSNYQMPTGQLDVNGSRVLNAGNYNSYSPTLTGGNASGTWGINITGRGYPRRWDGGDINFIWSGQGGQPPWLWGGSDGANMYVYNPSNFSVNYASTAGSVSGGLTTSNYSSYALPLSGGTMSGTITTSATSIIIGNHGGGVRGYLYQDTGGFGILTGGGSWNLHSYPGGGGNLYNTWTYGGHQILSANNYNSYAPTLTGGNASGTWSINITGNAGTVSNQSFTYSNDSDSHTYLWATSTNGQSRLVSRAAISVNYANSSGGIAGISINQNLSTSSGPTFNTVYTDNWFRSWYTTGWFNGTYSGGIYMEDTTWVRVYNNKSFYTSANIGAGGDITAYWSDERLKTKLGIIDNAREKIKTLDGFYYINNDIAKQYGYQEEKRQVGLSAQQVQKILPEIVSLAPFDMETGEHTGIITSKSGENYLTVKYDRLVPLLVEGFKEQDKLIDLQSSRIEHLENIVKQILARME